MPLWAGRRPPRNVDAAVQLSVSLMVGMGGKGARMRSRTALLVVVLVMAFALTGCSGDSTEPETSEPAATQPPSTTTTTTAPTTTTTAVAAIQKDLVYGTWEDLALTLDMQAPVQPAGAPVVIHLPGKGGDDTPTRMVEDLAEEGAIVFVVQYPLVTMSSWDDPGEVILGNHGAGARAMAEGVACAIRFAREQASELGSDDPVVVLSGFSFGGGIAAHVALFGAALDERWDEYAAEGGPPRQVDCEVTEGSTHVDALVGMAGTYEVFVPLYDGTWGRAYQQESDQRLWEFLSSPSGTNPDLTIRLLHGDSDPGTTYQNSVEFAAALTEASYNAGEVVAFEGGHTVPTDLATATIIELLGQ